MERSCEGCTKCCEGWLTTEIKGIPIYPGNPCQFVQIGRGCVSYGSRPKNPCRTFKCGYLLDHSIPEWMKPSSSGVIIARRTVENHNYVELCTTGHAVDENVLTWFFLWGLQNHGNIRWMNKSGQSHYYGSSEFARAMRRHLNGGPATHATSE